MNKYLIFLFILALPFKLISAEKVTKREFVKNGKIYIEERSEDENGHSTITYPKPSKEESVSTVEIKEYPDGSAKYISKTSADGINVDISMGYSKQEMEDMKKMTKDFFDALQNCTPFEKTYKTKLFDQMSIKVKKVIHGKIGDKCKVSQTIVHPIQKTTCLPNDTEWKYAQMTVTPNQETTCLYTGTQRIEIIANPNIALKYDEDNKVCTNKDL